MVVLAPSDVQALDEAFRIGDSSARADAAHGALLAIRRKHSGASPEDLLAGILRALAERNKWDEGILHYQRDTVPLTLDMVGLGDFLRVLDVVLNLPQPSDSDDFKNSLMTFLREGARRYTPRNNETIARRVAELLNSDTSWEQSVGLAAAAPMLGKILSTLNDDEQVFQLARGLHRAWFAAPFQSMFITDAYFAQQLRNDIARAVSQWHAPSARYFAPLLRLPASDDPNFAVADDYPAVPFIYLANPTDGLMTQQFVHHKGEYLVNWLDEYGLEELAQSPDYDRDTIDAVGDAFRDDPKNIERLMEASISLNAHPEVCAFVVPALAARYPDIARERHREYLQQMEQSIRTATTTPIANMTVDDSAYTERLRYAPWVGRYSPELRPLVTSAFLNILEWLVNGYTESGSDTKERHRFAHMAKLVAEFFADLDGNKPHPRFGTELMGYALATAGHWLALRDPTLSLGLPQNDLNLATRLRDEMRDEQFKKTVCGD